MVGLIIIVIMLVLIPWLLPLSCMRIGKNGTESEPAKKTFILWSCAKEQYDDMDAIATTFAVANFYIERNSMIPKFGRSVYHVSAFLKKASDEWDKFSADKKLFPSEIIETPVGPVIPDLLLMNKVGLFHKDFHYFHPDFDQRYTMRLGITLGKPRAAFVVSNTLHDFLMDVYRNYKEDVKWG